MAKRIFFLTGNESQSALSIFLENLMVVSRQNGTNPLFVETKDNFIITSTKKIKMKDRDLKLYEHYPDLGITTLSAERLRSAALDKNNREFFKTRNAFDDIFICDEIKDETFCFVEHCDALVILMENDVYCSGYLYSLLKYLEGRNIYKRIILVISGVKIIEKAVEVFLFRKQELENMFGHKMDIVFGGLFFMDVKRISHAIRIAEPLCTVFSESPISGVLHYIVRNLDAVQPLLHDQSFFAAVGSSGM